MVFRNDKRGYGKGEGAERSARRAHMGTTRRAKYHRTTNDILRAP